jgi:hypothetical protein
MEIIVVAILALVLLSPLDASRWSRKAKDARRSRAKAGASKSRRRSRRVASSHRLPTLSYATPRASAASRARWWWE